MSLSGEKTNMVKKAQNEWMSIYAEMNKTGFKDTIGAQPKKKKNSFV